MTGSHTNEKIKKKVLRYLYKKRYDGKVPLNDFWRKNIEEPHIRNTLAYLSTDTGSGLAKQNGEKVGYIVCNGHIDIGNKISGIDRNLDNTDVWAKITDDGIKFYRENYRNEYRNRIIFIVFVISSITGGILFIMERASQ